jgi:hypothetical protein
MAKKTKKPTLQQQVTILQQRLDEVTASNLALATALDTLRTAVNTGIQTLFGNDRLLAGAIDHHQHFVLPYLILR